MTKRIILILWLVFGYTAVWGGESYNRFVEAYRNKNYSQALGYIAQAYKEEPSENNIYWYGVSLYLNNRYAQSAEMLSRLPESYPYYPAQWYRTESYLKTGQTNRAVEVIKEVLTLPEDKNRTHVYFHTRLTGLLTQAGDVEQAREYEPSFRKYAEGYRDSTFEASYYYWGKFYLDNALKSALLKEHQRGQEYLSRAREYRKLSGTKYSSYIDLVTVGGELRKANRYDEALPYLETLPADERPLELAWTLSECYMNLGQTNRAAEALLRGLKYPGEESWKAAIYISLIRALSALRDTPTLLEREQEMTVFLEKEKYEHWDWVKYSLCKLYKETGEREFVSGNEKEAVKWLNQALRVNEKGLGKYDQYIKRHDLTVLRDAMSYWVGNYNRLREKAYVLKTVLMVFTDMDARWVDDKGKAHRELGKTAPEMTNALPPAVKMWNGLFFYYSQGQLLFESDIHVVTNRITDLRTHTYSERKGDTLIFEPDIRNLGTGFQSYLDSLKRYDVFVVYFPLDLTVDGAGGSATFFAPFSNIPYHATKGKRGRINLRSSYINSYGGLTHEFFHLVEGSYRIFHQFTAHVYTEDYRDMWPGWYHGEGEWTYYRKAFEQVVLPNGLEWLILRE